MYVTRPLSLYRRSPKCLSKPPPDGPNSGYLVILDEEAETTRCFGFSKNSDIRGLPFPQNKNLTINYQEGEHSRSYDLLFVPVLNQPLSSNQYYVIQRKGNHKGKACTNSKEEETWTCCFFSKAVKDVRPRELDPSDTYQQVEIFRKDCWEFSAKSVAQDGFPPQYLRGNWRVRARTPKSYQLHEAAGLNSSLRNRLPDFNPSLLSGTTQASETVVVGKWYCPFMFVHEQEMKLKDQMKRSTFYEVTLEKRWEKIFACENSETTKKNKVVNVDVFVQKEEVFIRGKAASFGDCYNGVMWFTSCVGGGKKQEYERRVGLSMLVVERMKWEEERVGWVENGKRQVRVEKAEEYKGIGGQWSKFYFFVLVESFVFKRMDGSVMLTYDFKHTHQIKCKWE